MVLNQISTRHKRINRCSRETDGAGSYNSVFVALFTLQLGQGGKSGNIKVVQHGHNEPGHGSDICDTAGNKAYLDIDVTRLTSCSLQVSLCARCKLYTGVLAIDKKNRGFYHFGISHYQMFARG